MKRIIYQLLYLLAFDKAVCTLPDAGKLDELLTKGMPTPLSSIHQE